MLYVIVSIIYTLSDFNLTAEHGTHGTVVAFKLAAIGLYSNCLESKS